MNEPKRRGRPPKAATVHEYMVAVKRAIAPEATTDAQAYAKRVWDGQNRDIPRKERLERVAKALAGQGLSMEGVSL